MEILLKFHKRDLLLLQNFLASSYDNFYQGIDPLILRKSEIQKEIKQLTRIKKAFQPVMGGK